MLHLQARVHFHEVELSVVDDEFDGAGAAVVDRSSRRHRGLAHLAAAFDRHAWRGRFFGDLLMAALHRAIALEQINRIPMVVPEHLHFDVPRRREVFLDQYAIVLEAGRRLALAARERAREIRRAVNTPHALATASGHRFDEHGKADARASLDR